MPSVLLMINSLGLHSCSSALVLMTIVLDYAERIDPEVPQAEARNCSDSVLKSLWKLAPRDLLLKRWQGGSGSLDEGWNPSNGPNKRSEHVAASLLGAI